MEDYFQLAEQFTTQSEPEFCGPASLIMVLNALNIDPNKPWKGIWRWFTEEVLHCTSVEAMKKGMSLEEMTILARCNGLHTQTFRPLGDKFDQKFNLIKQDILDHQHSNHTHTGQCHVDHDHISQAVIINNVVHHNTSAAYIKRFDLDLFRTIVQSVSRREGIYAIANISRKTLGQTGDGHFTPIGGYHHNSDKVLLFDTARFKYPPHWVDLNLLHQAVSTKDSESQNQRGVIVMTQKIRKDQQRSKICQIQNDNEAIRVASEMFCQKLRSSFYLKYSHEKGESKPSLESKIHFLLENLNEDHIRTILFTYLNEMINIYQNESLPPFMIEKYYISKMFEQLVEQIEKDYTYSYLKQRLNEFSSSKLFKMIDFMVIDFAPHIVTLLLHSLPKQTIYQLKVCSESTPEEDIFWQNIIDATLDERMQSEVDVIRYHFGIHDEYCHISSFSSSKTHTFFKGHSKVFK